MEGTAELHGDVLGEFTSYMDTYMAEFCVNFEDEEGNWVPVDSIKHTYTSDKIFWFRLTRFLKVLSSKYLRVVEEDNLVDLGMGNIGTRFLTWDMTLALLILEGT